jgi:hypothetical protein
VGVAEGGVVGVDENAAAGGVCGCGCGCDREAGPNTVDVGLLSAKTDRSDAGLGLPAGSGAGPMACTTPYTSMMSRMPRNALELRVSEVNTNTPGCGYI